MPETLFACPKCNAAFSVAPGTDHVTSSCPNCSSSLDAYFFPAFFRARQVGAAPTALADQTEASCFYHQQKQAIRVCDGCGRMICSLCSIEMGTEHLCPNCISSGRKKGKIVTLEGRRTRYDSIAMSLAIFGLILGGASVGFLTLIMAPTAIYISIRHWNSPGSLLGVSKTRFVLAIILSILGLCFSAFLIGAIFLDLGKAHHR